MSDPRDNPDQVTANQLRHELHEEFAHHIDMIERSEIACGATPDAARASAVKRFGDQSRAAAECERIVMGASHMAGTWNIARIVGVVLWRIGVAASLLFCIGLSYAAYRQSKEATNLAVLVGEKAGVNLAGGAALSPSERASILASIWGPTSGKIEVRGAVRMPGKFYVDTHAPLDLAALIERAGGASEGAQSIVWNQRGEPGDIHVTITNAERFRGDFNTMPAPGSIITVK